MPPIYIKIVKVQPEQLQGGSQCRFSPPILGYVSSVDRHGSSVCNCKTFAAAQFCCRVKDQYTFIGRAISEPEHIERFVTDATILENVVIEQETHET